MAPSPIRLAGTAASLPIHCLVGMFNGLPSREPFNGRTASRSRVAATGCCTCLFWRTACRLPPWVCCTTWVSVVLLALGCTCTRTSTSLSWTSTSRHSKHGECSASCIFLQMCSGRSNNNTVELSSFKDSECRIAMSVAAAVLIAAA